MIRLAMLADTLGVTVAFLTHAGRPRGGMAMDAHMRRRATAPAGTWRQLEARLNMYRWHARHLFEEVSLRAEQHVPTLDLLDVTPEHAARFVRAQWRMPAGPVRHLAQWLEAASRLLIGEDFATSRVDGLSQWVGDYPVILFNDTAPPDRVRLTLAHELGHLVLHADALSVDDVEAQANAFAGEFLMPAEVIRPALRNLKIGRLLDLKREYGVSMQALVERAYHLDLLSPTQRTSMYKMFSAKGWRSREPGSDDIATEQPALAEAIAQELSTRVRGRGELSRRVISWAMGPLGVGRTLRRRPQPPKYNVSSVARSQHAEAARKCVARLVAVVAVVAGLVVLIAPLCGSRMFMAPVGDAGSATGSIGAAEDHGPMPAAGSSYSDTVTIMDLGVVHCGPGAGGLLGSSSEPAMPGEAFLVCITILIAILPMLLALWPRWSIHPGRIRPAEPVRILVHRVRQQSLAELCVLRT